MTTLKTVSPFAGVQLSDYQSVSAPAAGSGQTPDSLVHTLCFKNISKSALVLGKNTCILNQCVGFVSSGEMLGIMGLGRCGKTSLMNILSGRDHNFTGEVLVDGVDISHVRGSTAIGYVMQYDIFFEDLSFEEILTYATQLRSTRRVKPGAVKSIVKIMMEKLYMVESANKKAALLTYSERKYLSLGVELLAHPNILLVDEPTTHLDSSTGAGFMLTLRYLAGSTYDPNTGTEPLHWQKLVPAKAGIAIVTVLQNPSSYAFYTLDKVIFMHEGGMVYYGGAMDCMSYLKKVGYTLPVRVNELGSQTSMAYNPADFFLELLSSLDVQTAGPHPPAAGNGTNLNITSRYNSAYIGWLPKYILATLFEADKAVAAVNAHLGQQYSVHSSMPVPYLHKNDPLLEVQLMIMRAYDCSMRGEFTSHVKLVEVIIVAFLAGTVWMQTVITEDTVTSASGCIFFMIVYWFFTSTFASTLSFFTEKFALEREYKAGTYRLGSYIIGKAIGTIPSRMFMPTLFVLICYPISFAPSVWDTAGDVGRVFAIIFVIILTICACDGLGLLLASSFNQLPTSLSFTNGLGMCALLFGGFYSGSAQWSGVSWIKTLSLVRFTYNACAGLQFEKPSTYKCDGGMYFASCIPDPNNPNPSVSSTEVIDLLGVGAHSVGENIGIIILFLVCFYTLTYLMLWHKFNKTW